MAIDVLVPLALPSTLTYAWPQHEAAPTTGQWVEVPVGTKTVHGLVIGPSSSQFAKLKTATPLPIPALPPKMLAFYRWVAAYNLAAPGEALRVALPRALTPALPKRVAKPKTHPAPHVPQLSPAQQAIATTLISATSNFKTFLLDGVTGSGKTETYAELLAHTLHHGGQTLLLVPEIALTPQLHQRMEARLGQTVHLWHSGLAEGARKRAWWAAVNGEAGVWLGARSALFLPWQRLQAVVVDEEHDPSYKQGEGFLYHGRDMAVQLAHTWQCPCILASATPSLESWHRAQSAKYTHLTLPSRHGGASLPSLQLVDLRQKTKGTPPTLVSPTLRQALTTTIAKGQQALLFLNRRGNAPLLLCTACGARRDCARCSASLVVHGDQLWCHHCGYKEPHPSECPSCGENALKPYGPGTRRVAAEVQAWQPSWRVAVADSDSTSTPLQIGQLVAQLQAGEIDVVIGTQLMTKGHDLPNLTCVGVIDADMGLAHGDLRAAERTFAILTQVAGRAGRGQYAGSVYLQTHTPDHPLFTALLAGDRNGFYAQELAARQPWGDPPFGHLTALILSGVTEAMVIHAAHTLAKAFHAQPPVHHTLLGPAPALLAKKNDLHRWRLLVKAPKVNHAFLKHWLENTALPKGVTTRLEVDPVSFS